MVYVLGAVASSEELVCRSVPWQGILHGAFWKVLWRQLVFNDAGCGGMQSVVSESKRCREVILGDKTVGRSVLSPKMEET